MRPDNAPRADGLAPYAPDSRPEDVSSAACALVLGPGQRLLRLARHVAAAGSDVQTVEDLIELHPLARTARRLVVDAACTPREDLGLVRRAIQAGGAELWVVADDPNQGTARELCSAYGGRWMPWPPTIDEVAALAGVPDSVPAAAAVPAQAPTPTRTPAPAPARASDEIAQVESILGVEPLAAPTGAGGVKSAGPPVMHEAEDLDEVERILGRAPQWPVPGLQPPRPIDLDEEEGVEPAPGAREPRPSDQRARASDLEPALRDTGPSPLPVTEAELAAARSVRPAAAPRDDAFAEPAPAVAASSPAAEAVPHALPRLAVDSETPSKPAPTWMRDQVADLADQTTRIDLSLSVLTDQLEEMVDKPVGEEQREEIEQQVQAVRGETARLMGFARTLAFLAVPPARGDTVFDVGEVLKVYVSSMAKSGPDAPRILFRTQGPVLVRSDRGLLGVVFDALLFVARECASRGFVVKAQVLPPAEGKVAIEIDFPAGPLDGRTVENIFTPYALRRVLPSLGPNALPAAQAIIIGQGGTLSLRLPGRGRALWRVELPLSDK